MLKCKKITKNSTVSEVSFDYQTGEILCKDYEETRVGNLLEIDTSTCIIKADYILENADSIEIGPITYEDLWKVENIFPTVKVNNAVGEIDASTENFSGKYFLSTPNDPYIRANNILAGNESYVLWKFITSNIFGNPEPSQVSNVYRFDITELLYAVYQKYKYTRDSQGNSYNLNSALKAAAEEILKVLTKSTPSALVTSFNNMNAFLFETLLGNYNDAIYPPQPPRISLSFDSSTLESYIEISTADPRVENMTPKISYLIADLDPELKITDLVNSDKWVVVTSKSVKLAYKDHKDWFNNISKTFSKLIVAKVEINKIASTTTSYPGGFFCNGSGPSDISSNTQGDWLNIRNSNTVTGVPMTFKKTLQSEEEKYTGNVIR